MLNPSPKHNIFLKWLFWHFIEAPKNILLGWKNFLKFIFHYFSIGALLASFFAPWKGDLEDYGRGLDIKKYFNAFLGNMISRALAALIRLIIIVVGLFLALITFFIGFLILVVWLLLPVIVVGGVLYAIGVAV